MLSQKLLYLYMIFILARINFILLLSWLLISACKKEKKTTVTETPLPAASNQDTSAFSCKDLPPTPVPFGWRDTTTNVNQNINAFMFNPANPDEVVIVVNGDMFGYNKMFCVNVRTQQSVYLGNLDSHLPSVNQNGWVVYSSFDKNIYKIKCNGDSVKQITNNNAAEDPKWDYSGNYIYYFQGAFNNVPSQIVKTDANGKYVTYFLADVAYNAPFKKSDKLIYQKTNNTSVTLVIRDMATLKETNLISGPYDPKTNYIYFSNLCLDNSDQNFYWTTSYGIFRCSIGTLKIDTVLKNCPSIEYNRPVFQTSRPTEMLMACHFVKPLLPYALLHEYKAVERDMVTRDMNILKVFP
jgi:hypothetical protein